MPNEFAPLPLEAWRATRDTLAGYSRLVGRIRQHHTPPQKHWWHASLRLSTLGLTTTPLEDERGRPFELTLDLTEHQLTVTRGDGVSQAVPLSGQSVRTFKQELLAAMRSLDIRTGYHDEAHAFEDEAPGTYDEQAVAVFWETLRRIFFTLRAFRSSLREETGAVQFWPHHFDLAVLWFSGRKVPGQDPDNPAYADEQMNFGFSTGDDGIPEPYFYATAYPTPEGWTASALPAGAYWHSEGWTGAVLPYAHLVEAENGRALLLDFLKATQEAGANKMQTNGTRTSAE
ncbi:MAG: DUF5996 family protein [Candidatus Promineifilaceae bacterium]